MAETTYAVYAHNGAAYGSQLDTVTVDDSYTNDVEIASIVAAMLENYAEHNTLADGSTWAVVSTAIGG